MSRVTVKKWEGDEMSILAAACYGRLKELLPEGVTFVLALRREDSRATLGGNMPIDHLFDMLETVGDSEANAAKETS